MGKPLGLLQPLRCVPKVSLGMQRPLQCLGDRPPVFGGNTIEELLQILRKLDLGAHCWEGYVPAPEDAIGLSGKY
jgi:hypothetical protein